MGAGVPCFRRARSILVFNSCFPVLRVNRKWKMSFSVASIERIRQMWRPSLPSSAAQGERRGCRKNRLWLIASLVCAGGKDGGDAGKANLKGVRSKYRVSVRFSVRERWLLLLLCNTRIIACDSVCANTLLWWATPGYSCAWPGGSQLPWFL